jgi:hypothetical protein
MQYASLGSTCTYSVKSGLRNHGGLPGEDTDPHCQAVMMTTLVSDEVAFRQAMRAPSAMTTHCVRESYTQIVAAYPPHASCGADVRHGPNLLIAECVGGWWGFAHATAATAVREVIVALLDAGARLTCSVIIDLIHGGGADMIDFIRELAATRPGGLVGGVMCPPYHCGNDAQGWACSGERSCLQNILLHMLYMNGDCLSHEEVRLILEVLVPPFGTSGLQTLGFEVGQMWGPLSQDGCTTSLEHLVTFSNVVPTTARWCVISVLDTARPSPRFWEAFVAHLRRALASASTLREEVTAAEHVIAGHRDYVRHQWKPHALAAVHGAFPEFFPIVRTFP